MNRWDQRFSEPGFAYGTEPNDYLVETAPHLNPSSTILSLAEGEGRNAVYLAKLGHRVVGVDTSRVGLEKAHEFAKKSGVGIETVLSDVNEYDMGENKWDAIISIWCHVLTSERVSLHEKVARALKPGGLFIYEAYTPKKRSA